MPLKVCKYEDKHSEEWDSFVKSSLNGTIFHMRKFLDYHPKGRFDDDSLMFFNGNHLEAVFPAVNLAKDKKILKSHAGSSYGGIIVKRRPGIDYALELTEKLTEYAKASEYDSIEFRIAEKIFNKEFCEELDFAYLKSGFFIESSELSSYVTIPDTTDLEAIIENFNPNARRNLRKALRSGLDLKYLEEELDIKEFWDMLKENLVKHKANPTHSFEELYDIKKRFPEEVEIIGVYKEGKIIAGITSFECNRQSAHCFYFASKPEGQPYRPLNLAVLELIRHCSGRKLKFLNFGISTEKSGEIINHGLFSFKESFGASGALRSYWIKSIRENI